MDAMLSLALGMMLAGNSAGPDWSSDYGVALREAQSESKPLLIVMDNPNQSTTRVEQVTWNGGSQEAQLLKPFKLCHVDVTTPYGKKVAKAFQTPGAPHTVIIDKTGAVQIFKRTGQFSKDQWRTTLVGYRAGLRKHRRVSRPVVCFT